MTTEAKSDRVGTFLMGNPGMFLQNVNPGTYLSLVSGEEIAFTEASLARVNPGKGFLLTSNVVVVIESHDAEETVWRKVGTDGHSKGGGSHVPPLTLPPESEAVSIPSAPDPTEIPTEPARFWRIDNPIAWLAGTGIVIGSYLALTRLTKE